MNRKELIKNNRIVKRPILLSCLAACMSGTPVIGHEFWIDAASYQVAPGTPIIANLKNGEEFVGTSLSYISHNIARFDMASGDTLFAVQGREGDIPALTTLVPGQGLWIALHETAPKTLRYRTWDKFQTFADHKDFPNIRQRHLERGLPEADFTERYTRHVKALFAVGDGTGADRASGLATEFVAMANPYTDDLSQGLPVQLLYRGSPRPDAQVEVFDRAPDGTVTVTLQRTDSRGQARIPVTSGHSYLLDAVVLRAAPPGSDAVWETLWAALTFSVP